MVSKEKRVESNRKLRWKTENRVRDRSVLRGERKKGTVVKGGENARGMKEEETQEGTEKKERKNSGPLFVV